MGKLHGKLVRERRQAKRKAHQEKVQRLKAKGIVKPKTDKQAQSTVVSDKQLKAAKQKGDFLRERRGIECIRPAEDAKIPKCPHGE